MYALSVSSNLYAAPRNGSTRLPLSQQNTYCPTVNLDMAFLPFVAQSGPVQWQGGPRSFSTVEGRRLSVPNVCESKKGTSVGNSKRRISEMNVSVSLHWELICHLQ